MTTLLDDIREKIGSLIEPRLNWRIDELNLIKEISLSKNSILIRIELIEDDPEKKAQFKDAVLASLEPFDLDKKTVRIDHIDVAANSLKQVDRIFLVASGKGGVGKSTVAVNVAAALHRRKYRVGILDADIYGPSIPILLGAHARPQVLDQEVLMPVQAHGMKLISMGNLIPRDNAVAWRSQLVNGTVLQFIRKVNWGQLDFLIVDLPPGTGDIHMTISREMHPDGVIIVSTPQIVAREDVIRCINMFENMKLPLTGLVENMVSWTCKNCGHEHPIFTGKDNQWHDLEKLATLPMRQNIWACSERGIPYYDATEDPDMKKAFDRIADALEK